MGERLRAATLSPMPINETHDPNLKSWVESANEPDTDFPIQNLPFCQFEGFDTGEHYNAGVAIGDQILSINALRNRDLFKGTLAQKQVHDSFDTNDLHGLLYYGADLVRRRLIEILRDDA